MKYPENVADFHWAVEIRAVEIWPDIILKSPARGAHAANEGEGWIIHGINVKAYILHS